MDDMKTDSEEMEWEGMNWIPLPRIQSVGRLL
jgi:hypothetical protein